MFLSEGTILPGSESKAATLAAGGLGTIRKKEQSSYVVAVPLICGERILACWRERVPESTRAPFANGRALLDAPRGQLLLRWPTRYASLKPKRLSQTDDLTKLHNALICDSFSSMKFAGARYGPACQGCSWTSTISNASTTARHLVGSHMLMEMAAVILSILSRMAFSNGAASSVPVFGSTRRTRSLRNAHGRYRE